MIRRLLAVLALATAVPGILIGVVIPASAGVRSAAAPARAARSLMELIHTVPAVRIG